VGFGVNVPVGVGFGVNVPVGVVYSSKKTGASRFWPTGAHGTYLAAQSKSSADTQSKSSADNTEP